MDKNIFQKIHFNNIGFIIKKELRSYFDNPTAYIVIVVFLLLWEFLFFRNAFIVGEASLRILFQLLPFLLLVLISAISMGSISQEQNEGTMELLLTHPISELELIAGKFLSLLLFILLTLSLTLPVVVTFRIFGKLDLGIVLAQYLSSLLLAGFFASLGIFISSLFRNQIVSLLVTLAGSFLITILGFELVTGSVPLTLAGLLESLSTLSHFDSMARGVLNLRDVLYFILGTTVFLSLTYLQFLKHRYGNRKKMYQSYQLFIALFVVITVLLSVLGSRIPGQIDLSQGKIFTMSSATEEVVSTVPDIVHLTLYASPSLPSQLQPILRDIKDILRDYQILGKGNIVVENKDTSQAEVAEEATGFGVQQMQFNVIDQEAFQVKNGFLGLVITYGKDHEVLPYIESTTEFEYQVTSNIKKLTNTNKKKIAFLAGHGEKSYLQDYSILQSEVGKQYVLSELTFSDSQKTVPDDVSVLVIAGPTQKIDDIGRVAIDDFHKRGGSLLLMLDTIQIDPQSLTVTPSTDSFNDYISQFGVNVDSSVVYDLRSSEIVSFGGGASTYNVNYPFWIRALSTSTTTPLLSNIDSIVFPWTSSLTVNSQKLDELHLTVTELFKTSRFGGVQKDSYDLAPTATLSNQNLGEQLVGVSLEGFEKGSRIVVVGNSLFLSDQFTSNAPNNLGFGMQTLSYLAQEQSLASIQLKQREPQKLFFESNTQMGLVKYGNMAFVILFPIAVAAFRIIRRRNLRKKQYSIEGAA